MEIADGGSLNVDPNFEDVPFEADTGYVELVEGSWVVMAVRDDGPIARLRPGNGALFFRRFGDLA